MTAPAIFCDSFAALEAAAAFDHEPHSSILTVSPFLAHRLPARAVFLPDRLSRARITDLQDLRKPLQCHALEIASAEEALRPFEGIAAVNALRSVEQIALAACLEERELSEPVVILNVETGQPAANDLFNGPWADLLAGNSQAECRHVPVEVGQTVHRQGGGAPDLLSRMRLAGVRRALYRVFRDRALPRLGAKAMDVWILGENELLQETAVALALRGSRIRTLRLTPDQSPLPEGTEQALDRCLEKVLEPALDEFVLPPLHRPLLKRLCATLQADAERQFSAASQLEKMPLRSEPGRDAVVLCNFPCKPENFAVRLKCEAEGMLFAGFQHGVSPEICARHEDTLSTYDIYNAHRGYMFNDGGAAVANDIPGRKGTAVSVGMPADYRRAGGAGFHKSQNEPITFVSTSVYHGYSGKFSYGPQNDREMFGLDLTLLQDVFGKLPHAVLYKTYPSRRFPDDDPTVEIARSLGNVHPFTGMIDLRYLLNRTRVLVTCRATSTVSWCLMSGKPLVFIDVDDNMPLRPEAKTAFERGTFLFSTKDPNWVTALLTFLSRPIEEIEEDWDEKREHRQALVRKYFDSGGGGGRAAATHILGDIETTSSVAAGESEGYV